MITKNSFICNLIEDNPNDWEQICGSKNISVKFENDSEQLAIFNYGISADFSDPVVQEARGIIIDVIRKEVVCWPFRKFGNSHESYADRIDWSSAQVQEKIDGSIVKLWFDEDISKWRWSSNGCIGLAEAKLSNGLSLADILIKTEEYLKIKNMIETGQLDIDNTYIFELVSPYNQVVIRYNRPTLYHIGVRNNVTGEESPYKLEGIPSPNLYSLHSEKDCLQAAEKLNQGDYPDNEGFVVVDKDWHRVKIKSPQYLIYHHAIGQGHINKKKAIEVLLEDDFNADIFLKEVPESVAQAFRFYQEQFEDTCKQIGRWVQNARDYRDRGLSRKEIALKVKGNSYATFCFKALDSEDPADVIIRNSIDYICKMIPDFSLEVRDTSIEKT